MPPAAPKIDILPLLKDIVPPIQVNIGFDAFEYR